MSVVKDLVVTLALYLGSLVALAVPAWLLWNVMCPELFGWPSVGYSQMVGLLWLVGCVASVFATVHGLGREFWQG